MAKAETLERVEMILRALLAVVAERERREGATLNDVAAVLARSGMPFADIAAVLDTTPDAARVSARRGRKKDKNATRSRGKVAKDA